MKVPRNLSIFVQYILDEWIPPIIRDSRIFMYLPMKFVLKDATHDFMNFKNWVFEGSDKDFSNLYERTLHVQELQGETDLNKKTIEEILKIIKDKKVLEVGCGRAYLSGLLAQHNKVTAVDIVVSKELVKKYPKVKFVEGNIENLPFKNQSFDVVVTTHTLEHVKNLGLAYSEIRRVAKEKVIIVVPRQRPYKYTFSLHTQFFPYEWSLKEAFGFNKKTTSIKNYGDWMYVDNVK